MDLQGIVRRLASRGPAALEAAATGTHAADARAVPTGRPLSTLHPGAYSAACVDFLLGDACPFLHRPATLSCTHVFGALPWREELECAHPGDVLPYRAPDRSRVGDTKFTARFAGIAPST